MEKHNKYDKIINILIAALMVVLFSLSVFYIVIINQLIK